MKCVSSLVGLVGISCLVLACSSAATPRGAAADGGAASTPAPAPAADPPTTQEAASCVVQAAAYCARADACAPYTTASEFGDRAACQSDFRLDCERTEALPGVQTVAASCTIATQAPTTCDLARDQAASTGCDSPPGTLATGAACENGRQCASGACDTSTGSKGCGTCAASARGEGAACDDEIGGRACLRDFVCVGSVCRKPGLPGAACASSDACAFPQSCQAGTCSFGLGEGATCDLAAPGLDRDPCDLRASLRCRGGHCTAFKVGVVGSVCSGDPDADIAICPGTTACIDDRCVVRPAVGAPCTDEGPSCLGSARCVNGTCMALPPSLCAQN